MNLGRFQKNSQGINHASGSCIPHTRGARELQCNYSELRSSCNVRLRVPGIVFDAQLFEGYRDNWFQEKGWKSDSESCITWHCNAARYRVSHRSQTSSWPGCAHRLTFTRSDLVSDFHLRLLAHRRSATRRSACHRANLRKTTCPFHLQTPPYVFRELITPKKPRCTD